MLARISAALVLLTFASQADAQSSPARVEILAQSGTERSL